MLEGGTRSPVQAVVRKCVIDYLTPARFDDPLAIRVRTAYRAGAARGFEYVVDNVENGMRPVIGQTTLVCVEMAPAQHSLAGSVELADPRVRGREPAARQG